MNCQYCNKICLRIDDDFHRCCNCYADFHDNRINISTRIRDRTFVVTLYHKEKTAKDFYKAIIGTAKEPMMIQLMHDPHITPQNIQQKLKTLLPFS